MQENNNRQGKSLVVNCSLCDATMTREETLQSYGQVIINAANVVVSPESAALLHRYNVNLNASGVITAPAGTQIITQNGKCRISGDKVLDKPVMLMLNGVLNIEPGAEEALKSYAAIIVNGSIYYPESLAPYISNIQLNGSSEGYPDDAVLLKKKFIVDKVFLLRAKAAKYFASRQVIINDTSLDVASLVKKGVHFITKTAIIAEPLLEAAIPLFGDEVEIVVIPEGCAYINEDVTLDDRTQRKYGNRLYIDGNLTLNDKSGNALNALEFLHVNGDVRLPSALADAFAAIDAEYNDLIIVKGVCFCEQAKVKISHEMLEKEEGVTLCDCAIVKIAEDIPAGLIAERLDIRGCAVVNCTPEQRDAVESVCTDVAVIQDGSDEDGEEGSMAGLMKDVLTGRKQVINAVNYQL